MIFTRLAGFRIRRFASSKIICGFGRCDSATLQGWFVRRYSQAIATRLGDSSNHLGYPVPRIEIRLSHPRKADPQSRRSDHQTDDRNDVQNDNQSDPDICEPQKRLIKDPGRLFSFQQPTEHAANVVIEGPRRAGHSRGALGRWGAPLADVSLEGAAELIIVFGLDRFRVFDAKPFQHRPRVLSETVRRARLGGIKHQLIEPVDSAQATEGRTICPFDRFVSGLLVVRASCRRHCRAIRRRALVKTSPVSRRLKTSAPILLAARRSSRILLRLRSAWLERRASILLAARRLLRIYFDCGAPGRRRVRRSCLRQRSPR